MAFDHEKLDVYQLAIEFVARANDIVNKALLERIAQMLTKLIKSRRPTGSPEPAPVR